MILREGFSTHANLLDTIHSSIIDEGRIIGRGMFPPATASKGLWGKESLCFPPLYWCLPALIFSTIERQVQAL